jgi:hypothetical protein
MIALLDERAQHTRGDEGSKRNEGRNVPRGSQARELARLRVEVARVTQSLPARANDKSGLTGVRSDEVARANSAVDVGGFGKVSTVLLRGAVNGVPAGSGRRPRGHGAVNGVKPQRVFGVDAHDLGPRNINRAKHVANAHAGVVNVNSWAPKSSPRRKAHEPQRGQQQEHIEPSSGEGRNDKNDQEARGYSNSKGAAEARVQSEGCEHPTMFARARMNKAERRTCK